MEGNGFTSGQRHTLPLLTISPGIVPMPYREGRDGETERFENDTHADVSYAQQMPHTHGLHLDPLGLELRGVEDAFHGDGTMLHGLLFLRPCARLD